MFQKESPKRNPISKKSHHNVIQYHSLEGKKWRISPKCDILSRLPCVDRYSTLLKHYLESQYSYVFAAQYQEALQDSILQGKTLSADMTSMFSKWKGFMQPLMLEVINLK